MKSRLHTCPLCQTDLKDAYFAGGESYCKCGWSSAKYTQVMDNRHDSHMATRLAIAAGVMSLLFGCLLFLTSMSGQIFLIKQKMNIGIAGTEDMKELSERCLKVSDKDCALAALRAASLNDPKNLEMLLELARMEMSMNEYAGAALTYKSYLEKGGEDQDVVYRVGKALALAGERLEARRYYEQAINDQPKSMNVSATRGLVRLLIEDGEFRAARRIIVQFQKKTRSKTDYFGDEKKMLRLAVASR